MPPARIQSLAFRSPESGQQPDSGSADLEVGLEDGKRSAFVVATADQPGRWMLDSKKGYSFGTPVVFVGRLSQETVAAAAQAMAEEMGGYWLRYYNSDTDVSAVARTLAAGRLSPAAPSKPKPRRKRKATS